MRKIYSLSFLLLLAFSLSAAKYRIFNADQFYSLLQGKNVVVLDIRSAKDYVASHIPGAQNIDARSRDFEQRAKLLNHKATVAVYSLKGKNSNSVASQLAQWGYRVVELEGGLNAWKTAGYRVYTKDMDLVYELEIFQVSIDGSKPQTIVGQGKFSFRQGFVQLSLQSSNDYFVLRPSELTSATEQNGILSLVYTSPDGSLDGKQILTISSDFNDTFSIGIRNSITEKSTVWYCRIVAATPFVPLSEKVSVEPQQTEENVSACDND
ncbi:MAG: rhodanese-like domain-containing protein [Paludibacteraceae bacterium]|nr:rhodanese-like domain-containing protein [Paludibacteraceae bacterium]